MENEPPMVPVDSSMFKLLCLLLPGPPRFLYLTSLSKLSGRALLWLAVLLVQSTVVVVPGLLWYAAGVIHAIARVWDHLTLQHDETTGIGLFAGSRRMAVPGQGAVSHVSQTFYLAVLLLSVHLLLAYAAMQYLKAARQRETELLETALTPESIVGRNSDWQEAWPTDYGQGIPHGDASSLPVDRSVQQPRDQTMEHDINALFSNIRGLKRRLYGSDADIAIKGKRDIATAAAEIDRSVRAEPTHMQDGHALHMQVCQYKLVNGYMDSKTPKPPAESHVRHTRPFVRFAHCHQKSYELQPVVQLYWLQCFSFSCRN